VLDHYAYYLKVLERSVRNTLRWQCMDPESPLYGTIESVAAGYTEPHSAVGVARTLIEGCYAPGSTFCGDMQLLRRAAAAMRCAASLQHEDGTLDLLCTNFHDAAETSFIMQTIGPACLLMRARMGSRPEEEELRALLEGFVSRAADGILAGGFHTPNHRWVLCAALALCARLTGRADCLARIDDFLREGIDCDEEGEYTERSSGTYNIVCDRSLIIMAEMLDMPGLLDHVGRNLDMVEKYVEADGTINTANSTRQDAGTAPDWRIYYGCYLYMALRTNNAEYAWMADRMLLQSQSALEMSRDDRSLTPFFDMACFAIADPALLERMRDIEPRMPDFNYVKHFEKSGIVRARRGDFSLTLLSGHPVFAMLRCGSHSACLRMAASFYARAQFAPQALIPTEDGFRLSFAVRWGYKGPLPEKPATSDWRQMDHSKRPDVFMQDLRFRVDVRILPDGARFGVSAEGQDRVPMKLEILLDPGARFATEDIEFRARPGDYVYMKGPRAEYRYPDHRRLLIDGGFHSHSWGENMRGTLPGDDSSFYVAMTGDTPVHETVTLRFEG